MWDSEMLHNLIADKTPVFPNVCVFTKTEKGRRRRREGEMREESRFEETEEEEEEEEKGKRQWLTREGEDKLSTSAFYNTHVPSHQVYVNPDIPIRKRKRKREKIRTDQF